MGLPLSNWYNHRGQVRLTRRDFPAVSSTNIRTSYSYDSAGRLEYETITREAGGTTNLTRTNYDYSFASYHRQIVRTEQEYQVATWANSDKTTYKYDGMERQDYEERHDWDDVNSTWVNRYDVTQEYDKNGNRTRLHRNVAAGYTGSYGKVMDLSYTFDTVNALTTITDSDDALYSCTVACDANNNITQIQETATVGEYTADLYTTFNYDWANRMEYSQVRAFDSNQKDWELTKREHQFDAAGRLVNSTYKQWWESGEEPSGDSVEHIYDGYKFIQNHDGSSSYGKPWHWAGVQKSHESPVKSPNPDTASQDGYNIANDKTPQRRTWQNPTTAGDERNLYGQGKPMAKDSSGSGADWSAGITSDTPDATVLQVESRFDFDGTVAPTDLDRATDVREKYRMGIFGSALSYAGSGGRVTSEPLGRDLNPLGRGSGYGYVAGALRISVLAPILPGAHPEGGNGNSVNNPGQSCPLNPECGSGNRCCCPSWIGLEGPWRLEQRDVCSLRCNGLEWDEDPARCHQIECQCIALGCRNYEMDFLPCQEQHYMSCGCNQYGTLVPATGEAGDCEPGYIIGSGDGSPGGGGSPDACPGCGGGGSDYYSALSTPSVSVDGNCRKWFQFFSLVKENVKKACNNLLKCKCLPDDVKACLRKVCTGSLFTNTGVRIVCDENCGKGELAYNSNSSSICGDPEPSAFITLCIGSVVPYPIFINNQLGGFVMNLSQPSIRVLGHELLHACDCKRGNHNNKNCFATNVAEGGNQGDEGWVQACENACFGYDEHGYTYSLFGEYSSWCCLCGNCY